MAVPPVPLMALEAVVLDTETTGLDTRRDRVVQIGAVELHGRRLGDGEFHTLVDPGMPIPPAATTIHGLGDADVAAAPGFADIAPGLAAFIAGRVVIGHNTGFDLAMLAAEHRRAGLDWTEPRSLDLRLLSQVCEPRLPDHSIEALATWLGVEVTDRHTALGDARATALLFIALMPRLRQRNIRTLAEAETACAGLTDVLDRQHQAGWTTPQRREQAALSETALARIDAYPYRHRVREAMTRPPVVVSPDTTMTATLQLMTEQRISSCFVADEAEPYAADCGILTERDFMRAIAAEGAPALEAPVSRFRRAPLECVSGEAFLYLAIGRMARLRIRHLGVVDDEGRLVGALSQRDLLRLRASEAIGLGDEILVAETPGELAAAWSKRAAMARALLAEGVAAREVTAVLSRSLCALTGRATRLAEARLADEGRGGPPVAYAMLVMGSGGRGESMLAPDQDNGIVHEDVPEGQAEAVDGWFAELGRHVADVLDAVGIPYCRGGVMASNPEWRGGLSTWKERVAGWVRRQRPEDLLNVDIFFDLRAVHGDAALARTLWHHAYETGGQGTAFAKLLAELGAYDPPIGLLGGLRTENGRLDLKMRGVFPIVAAARVLSILHHVLERATPARLKGLRALNLGSGEDIDRLLEMHQFLIGLILDQQLTDIDDGIPTSNRVQVSRLSRRRTAELKSALRDLGMIDQMVRDLLFAQ